MIITLFVLLSHGDLDGVNHWEHIVAPPPPPETTSSSSTLRGSASEHAEAADRGLDTTTTGDDDDDDDTDTAALYDVRSELLYNYDPYVLWAADNNA